MAVRYFSTDRAPAVIMRRTETTAGIVDEAWVEGQWQPTKRIVDFMFGEDDDVDDLPAELVPPELR